MSGSPAPSPPDLDRILAAIREEARRRGARERPGADVRTSTGGQPSWLRRPALAGDPRHVRDFLALGSEGLLDAAYRTLLNRPPDPRGAARYRHALRTGRRTKIEVLGRIRFSREGRRHGVAIPGLLPAFAFALAYRVPIAGAVLAGASALLRLPAHLRDRAPLERVAQEAAAEIEG